MFKKILIGLVLVLLVLFIGFITFIETSYRKNFDKDYPVTEIKVESDSAMIARGSYLVHGPAHCSHCHAPADQIDRVEAGEAVPLTGGFGLEIPPGTFYAPNITPDHETGIGNLTDGELYRMLRHNVNHRGEACVDFMPFINMADEDIYAIIAYLRAQEPVKHLQPTTEFTFLGKMIKAMGVIKPGDPDAEIPRSVKKEATAEYGHYLAYAVANCRGCHTQRDMRTGEYTGPFYAGGLAFGPDNATAGYVFHSPNLTPDPETGRISDWDLKTFIERMKAGRVHATSPMPWGAFTQMDTTDITAIFLFLKSLEPVHNEVPVLVEPPQIVMK